MSWTEAEATAHLRALFLEQMLPAATVGGKPQACFPLGADPAAPTYYIERQKPSMNREDFLVRTAAGGDDPIVALGELWSSQGLDRLAALAPQLAAAATALRQIEKPADDVSPFIYVMF
ncbi:MAG: hypothetical protein JNG90_12900 [Planctomycetaceae bacterium]|nr:hypothetical protein [Planctomycetaceae bacterium]